MLLATLSKKLKMGGAVETAHTVGDEEGAGPVDDGLRHDDEVCGQPVKRADHTHRRIFVT